MSSPEVTTAGKILVAYGSTTGCSRSYADVIAEQLSVTTGVPCDVDDVATNPNPDRYGGIVIVGSLYAMKWHSAIEAWLDNRSGQLRSHPIAAAMIGMAILNEERRASILTAINPLIETHSLNVVAREALPGWNLSSMLGLADRTLMKMMRQPEGDFRNFEIARAWADKIAPELV